MNHDADDMAIVDFVGNANWIASFSSLLVEESFLK
jgi:hypothetical protein